jgi:hypothetical protein
MKVEHVGVLNVDLYILYDQQRAPTDVLTCPTIEVLRTCSPRCLRLAYLLGCDSAVLICLGFLVPRQLGRYLDLEVFQGTFRADCPSCSCHQRRSAKMTAHGILDGSDCPSHTDKFLKNPLLTFFTHIIVLPIPQISSMSSSTSRSSSGGQSPTSTFSGLTKTPNLSLHSNTLLLS